MCSYTVHFRDDHNPEEHWQIPFTRHRDTEEDVVYWGMKAFTLR